MLWKKSPSMTLLYKSLPNPILNYFTHLCLQHLRRRMLGYSSDGELIGEGRNPWLECHEMSSWLPSRIRCVEESTACSIMQHNLWGCLIEVPSFGRQGDVACSSACQDLWSPHSTVSWQTAFIFCWHVSKLGAFNLRWVRSWIGKKGHAVSQTQGWQTWTVAQSPLWCGSMTLTTPEVLHIYIYCSDL